ncbi:endonuclease/exonuclease/phosphatase family protein [Aliikangiella coralliicola]|uniref:Endonuclease/exonuclease/phosphatase family protein n=1 Tax=Aliikangiella coralliicola TaxID=2592383 RepID=A0A545UH13_9GAMM|nr:endonuclease/exonuclease/phosphatase family protein [Aliikangiella coralliicola]TQV88757.1 endonuclease/exonuclease/phosphatase family protein [Aliikangiella coralliicola]
MLASIKKKTPVQRLILFFASLTFAFSILSLLAGHHRIFELMSHFKLQYLIGSIIFLSVFMLGKKWVLSLFTTGILALNSYFVLPWYYSSENSLKMEASQKIKLIHLNLLSSNQNYQGVIDFVEAEKPDIFMAQEVNTPWQEALAELTEAYPYNYVVPRPDNFGIAILSKKPLDTIIEKDWGNTRVPSLWVTFKLAGKTVNLVSTHPLPPISARYYQLRNKQLNAMMEELKTVDTPVILGGDFNMTMWSSDYSMFSNSQLKNTRQGFGILPTWPAKFSSLGIPIDHFLISRHFVVESMLNGPDVGSDHLPIVVSLKFSQ